MKLINSGKVLVLFKHSPICYISARAKRKIDLWSIKNNDLNIILIQVNVIQQRNLSQGIAEIFDVRHESPQIIIIDKSGKVIWSASHFSISEKNIESVLSNQVY